MIIAKKNTENGEVILREGPAGYEIIVDGQFLMSSASGNSSEVLVDFGLAGLKPRNGLQVLIGGLGLGFSLKTALLDSAVAEVTVIELENQIIEWHRQGLIGNTKQLLRDPRVRILNRDFLQFSEEWSARANPKYDLIALDIDNGPDWLSHEANARLYGKQVLKHLLGMLNHQGILTMWSAAPSTQLEQSLQQVFGNVTVKEAADHNGEGKVIMAYIYICQSR